MATGKAKKIGRPVTVGGTKDQHIVMSISLSRDMRDQIKAIAEEKGIGLSALMRMVIQRGLEGL